MKVIVDTHALIWWFNEPERLSKTAIPVLTDPGNTIYISAAVAWEIAIKVNLGKLNALPLAAELTRYVAGEGFTEQPITVDQAVRAGLLPRHHRDPFDRLLVAQSQDLSAPILSADTALDRYDIERLW
ncbi:MAG TPA: type II toxin-antitoxin system VapC family toxin [Terriglobales bacterium]